MKYLPFLLLLAGCNVGGPQLRWEWTEENRYWLNESNRSHALLTKGEPLDISPPFDGKPYPGPPF